MQEDLFRTGQKVAQSGVYRVLHSQHVLPVEITLRAGTEFPSCAACDEPVHFELGREVSLEDTNFRVTLYRIPPITETPKAA